MARGTAVKCGMFGLSLGLCGVALAQEPAGNDEESLEEIVVTGSRLPTDLDTFAGSVTVIDSATLEQQTKITSDLGQILSNTVPGMGMARGNEASNFSQTMRGRKPAVLIDGAPQTIPLREAGRDIRIISPAAIGRIEVIRGATSLYGMGGAGGVINYVTKRAQDYGGEDGLQFRTDLGAGSSLVEFGGDAADFEINQTMTGRIGKWDFVATGYFAESGLSYDAEGNLIAPSPSDSEGGTDEMRTESLFAKIGYEITDRQRIEFATSIYSAAQDTDYAIDFDNIEGGFQHPGPKTADIAPYFAEGIAIDPRTDNDFFTLAWSHANVLGSEVAVRSTFQEYHATFGFFTFEQWGLLPSEANPYGGGQTVLSSEKTGVRLDIRTPLDAMNAKLQWGVDYLSDTSSQHLRTGEYWMPEIDQEDISLFAQFETDLTEWLNVRGGLRHVDLTLEVPTFQTLQWHDTDPVLGIATLDTPIVGGNTVNGGEVGYNELLFNIGAVAQINDNFNVFATYSQGFITSDLGRIIRGFREPDISDLGEAEAQIVDSYELGLRSTFDRLAFSLVGYFAESENGTTYDAQTFAVTRAPEETWGFESTLEVNFTDSLSGNFSYSWVDGEFDANNDGIFEPFSASRVGPEKVSAQVKYQFNEDWEMFVQSVYSFEFEEDWGALTGASWGRNPIDSIFVTDVSVTGKVGPGYLSASVANIFNNDYFPVTSQFGKHTPWNYFKAPGAELSLRYTLEY